MMTSRSDMSVTVLSGGGGGARLADGCAAVTNRVTVIANTGDDAQVYGLWVSPDLDTVMYTLADRIDPERGWGYRDETYATLDTLAELGEDTWFTLGDKDLATHISRTQRLRSGMALSDVTSQLCAALGITAQLLPMSNEPVATRLRTDHGTLGFQDYFVHRQHRDRVHEISFNGITDAQPAPGVLRALTDSDLVVIGPSNPFVSIGPILAVPAVSECMRQSAAYRMGVSPIIGGDALKGPAADMLASFGHRVSALGVAEIYAGLLDMFVIDSRDAHLASSIEDLGMDVYVTDIMMSDARSRARVAEELMAVPR